MDNALPDKIPDIDPSKTVSPIGEETAGQPRSGAFEDFMNQPAQPMQTQGPQATGTSPYELTRGQVPPIQGATIESLQAQTNTTSDTLNNINDQLNTKNLKLKQSQKYLLRNKLSEADTHIRTAASKAGVDVGAPPSMTTKQNPIRRYLAYVSDSQNQISAVQAKLKEISANSQSLTPGEMLLIQVKLNKAQQALEYSSVLLGKAVDDIKTLFSVQI